MRCLYRATLLLLFAAGVGASPKALHEWRESEDIMAKTTGWMGGASGATGDWEHPSNWTNGQPDAADSVFVRETSVYAIDTNLDRTTDNGTAATETLTITDTFNANNIETVSIDGKTYTFQTTLTNVDGHVKIGADDEASIANLVAAISLGAGAGTAYAAATTLHTQVTAVVGAPANTMDLTARQKDASGNSLTTVETMTSGAFGGATMSGGSDGTGLDLAVFDVHEDYTKDIGASGTALKLNADKFVHRGTGTLYLHADGPTSIDRFILDSINAVDAAVLTNASTSNYNSVEVLRGALTLTPTQDGSTGYAVNRFNVAFFSNVFSDARVTISQGAGVITFLNVGGGIVTSSAVHKNINVSAGEITLNSAADFAGSAGVIVLAGGTVIFDVPDTQTAVNYLLLMSGLFDATQTTGAKQAALTELHPGAVFLRNEDFQTFVLTTIGE